jgi:small ligand-binding sensory domain FIST
MRWASTLSLRADGAAAFGEAGDALARELEGSAPDLLLVFASPSHAAGLERIAALAARRFPRALAAGCTGSGVIGGAHEAEEDPALSLTAAVLPGVALRALHVGAGPVPRDDAAGWRARLGLDPAARPKFLLLADPFTADAAAIIDGLGRAYPGAPQFGGLASGGRRPAENRLLLGADVHRSGAVVVAFSGDLAVDTLVAQGCRPVGEPMIVTRCKQGLLQQLDGRPPLQALAEVYSSLDARDRELVTHSSSSGSRCTPAPSSTRASSSSATSSAPTSAPARSPSPPSSGR